MEEVKTTENKEIEKTKKEIREEELQALIDEFYEGMA